MKPKLPQIKKLIKNEAFIFFILVIFVLSIMYAIYMSIQQIRVKVALEKVRDNGYPVTLKELNEYYTYVPEEENAALIYQKAFDLYKGDIELEKEFMDSLSEYNKPYKITNQEKVILYLNAHKESLDLIRKASKYKKCRFPIDLTNGPETLLPHLSALRQAARLLAMESLMALKEGKKEYALQNIHSIMKIGEHLKNEPILISYLVDISCIKMAIKALKNILENTDLTESELKEIDTILEKFDNTSSLFSAFVLETCFISAAADGRAEDLVFYFASDTDKQKYIEKYNSFSIKLFKFTGFHAKQRIRWAEWRLEYLNSIKGIELPELRDKMYDWDNKKDDLPDTAYIVKAFPGFPYSSISHGKFITQIRTMQLAIAIERFRLKNKCLPENLAELVPEFTKKVLKDPFETPFSLNGKVLPGTIKYFKYPHKHPMLKKKGDYLLYGIGEDGEDNNATFDIEEPFKKGTDIILSIVRKNRINE
jgi:hypothetical protein